MIKPSAATPKLLKHRGKAVVFESIEDFKAKIDDENLDIDENSVMVLKGCGPKGYPGMAEVGNMPLPPKVLRKGITDMVRISDARMSGTAYGTVVLHVAPESAAGGPLALVQTGDFIEIWCSQPPPRQCQHTQPLLRHCLVRDDKPCSKFIVKPHRSTGQVDVLAPRQDDFGRAFRQKRHPFTRFVQRGHAPALRVEWEFTPARAGLHSMRSPLR